MESERLTQVGDAIQASAASWSFGGGVPHLFDEHVSKSVPLYSQRHDLIVALSEFFLAEASVCYDIGCSTGRLIRRIAERNEAKRIEAIGIDLERGMIDYASANQNGTGVTFIHDDVVNVELKKADLVVAYYSIQFIRPRVRQIVINRIYEALNWGGAFLMFEKVRAPDARFQDIMSALYVDFKIEQGYSPAEILGKARSLTGVLEPFSTLGNTDLLKRAGFVDLMPILKYVCFEGYLAIK
jgi:tRNA (cmo5U34)-methyltransferase